MSSQVTAACRKCNNKAPAESFQLDYTAGMMVCFSCFKKRGKKPTVKEAPKPVEKKKPAGWDSEDELLERLIKDKRRSQSPVGKVERVPGEMYVKYTCNKCAFKFKYYPLHKKPRTCPYCNSPNPKIRVTGIL